uniref:Protein DETOXIFICATION n=1 Tax=Araucaria cunninghamii TaxID=56994 RepID=A0A0D6R6X3_ARACU
MSRGGGEVVYEYVQLNSLIPHYDSSHRRIGLSKTTWCECKAQWKLAAPTIAATLIQYLFTVVAELMAGHLGKFELAALAIAFTVLRGLAYPVMLGMANALETLCGQAFGARQLHMLGIYMQRSIIILAATAVILSVPCLFAEYIFKLLGQTTAIAAKSGVLLKWMLPQLFAFAVILPVQKFLHAQSLILPIVWISTGVLIFHVVFCWITAFELKLGLIGVVMTHNVSCWLVAIFQFMYVVLSDSCKASWTGFTVSAFRQLLSFLRLSIFSAIMVFLQIWYYQILVLLAGTLTDAEVDIDAISISINMIILEMMILFGFGVAVSIRVSNELGAGNAEAACFSVFVAVATSSIISICFAIIFLVCKNVLGYIFTASLAVAESVSQLVPFLAASVLLNGIQAVLSGAATGSGSQFYVAYVNLISCYLVGLPLGLLICYKFGLGVTGIWSGMIAGTTLQSLILLYTAWHTNWNEQARQAANSLSAWRIDSVASP